MFSSTNIPSVNKCLVMYFQPASQTIQPGVRTLRSAFKSGPLMKPVTCRTQRYARSSVPAKTSIVSLHPPLKVYSHRHSLGHQYNCRQLIIVLFASPLIVIFFSNAGSGKYHLRLLLILKYTVHIFPPGSVVSRLKK